MPTDQPNLLFIITDQQSSHMLSCAGNKHLHTPAMDSLAARGTRFTRAYCTNPVCAASRLSLLTGHYPSVIGMKHNGVPHLDTVPDTIKQSGMGWRLQQAGYKTLYGGKVHLPKMGVADVGFEKYTADERDELARLTAELLTHDHDQPFAMIASFVNPHDICYMAIRDSQQDDSERNLSKRGSVELATLDRALARPEGVDEDTFFAKHCPPLPENFDPQENEPGCVDQALDLRPFRRRAREQWDDKRWREHRWAYHRLTEFVDAQIGRVLDALAASGLDKNTIVIFTSDHGDHDASHRLEHKTLPYEQACRIPLIIAEPGGEAATCDALVSNGLDVIPTMCDYAGLEADPTLPGQSLRRLVVGDGQGDQFVSRDWIAVEHQFGRAIVGRQFKYALDDVGENREMLTDLHEDPGETRNLAADPAYAQMLNECRQEFGTIYKNSPWS